ncbi:hypothetical protein [Parashewanella tropica]|uniref:hypothetical protein n=1 Tax=Parashewanella tropica TaxID=2547970 RepID=UPI001059E79F|nr:hypothetical protein [Parashewanella tropica]
MATLLERPASTHSDSLTSSISEGIEYVEYEDENLDIGDHKYRVTQKGDWFTDRDEMYFFVQSEPPYRDARYAGCQNRIKRSDSSSEVKPFKMLSSSEARLIAFELMGSENPALWSPQKFVKQIIERTEDDLSWKIGEVLLEELKAGRPQPIIGFKQTCDEMKSELRKFLKFKEVSSENKVGIVQFISQLSELENSGYPYQESLQVSFIFPLIQGLVYNDFKNKACWKKALKDCGIAEIDARYQKAGFSKTASVSDVLNLPFHLMFEEASEEQHLHIEEVIKHISAISGIPARAGRTRFTVENLVSDFTQNWKEKLYFPSFTELTDKSLSLASHTPFVPWGFTKAIKVDHDSGNMSCVFFSLHDLLHELDICSHCCKYGEYKVVIGLFYNVLPRLPKPLMYCVRGYSFLWWHEEFDRSWNYNPTSYLDLKTLYAATDTVNCYARTRWKDWTSSQLVPLKNDSLIRTMFLFSEGGIPTAHSWKRQLTSSEFRYEKLKKRLQFCHSSHTFSPENKKKKQNLCDDLTSYVASYYRENNVYSLFDDKLKSAEIMYILFNKEWSKCVISEKLELIKVIFSKDAEYIWERYEL